MRDDDFRDFSRGVVAALHGIQNTIDGSSSTQQFIDINSNIALLNTTLRALSGKLEEALSVKLNEEILRALRERNDMLSLEVEKLRMEVTELKNGKTVSKVREHSEEAEEGESENSQRSGGNENSAVCHYESCC